MTIKVTYNVTDVYMSQSVSPVYITVSYSDGGASGGGVWGSITGTLSNQTDLQTALDAKLDESTIYGGTEGQILSKASATDFDFAWINNYAKYLATNVRNQTGSTINAFQVVYISGATGNKPLISLADADTEATSSKTYGVTATSIANNGTGDVVTAGELSGINTSAFNEGDLLWLSTTAGGVVTTPPTEPAHAVFIGYVVRSHPTLGVIDVAIANGYELNELHGVQITSVANNDGLFYNSSNSIWENKSITTALGYTPVPTTRNITINGVTYDLSADRTYTISTGISGSGASGQVTYWTGASAVSGSTGLVYNDSTGVMTLSKNQNAATLLTISNTTANSSSQSGIVFNTNSGITGGIGKYSSSTTAFKIIASSDLYFYNGNGGDISLLNDVPTGRIKFTAGAVSTSQMTLFANGNLAINSGVTDLGVRFGVVGDTLLRGSGNTSATTALSVLNTDNSILFDVRNDARARIGLISLYPTIDKGNTVNAGGGGLFIGYTSGATYVDIPSVTLGKQKSLALTPTANSMIMVSMLGNFAPTSGTATFFNTVIEPTINQTGGANGITRGLYVNPTLTSAADFRAIETSAGNVLFGASGTGFFWDNTNSRLGIGTNAFYTPALGWWGGTDQEQKLFLKSTASTKFTSLVISGGSTGSGGGAIQFLNFAGTPVADFGTADGGEIGFAARQNTANINFYTTPSGTSPTRRLSIFASGNVGIGGTLTSDPGTKFFVSGDTILRGSGATSATTALTVQDSASSDMLRVRNDSRLLIGGASTTAAPTIYAFSGITGNRSLRVGIQSAGSLTPTPAFNINQENDYTYTSGTGEFTTITANFLPTSGTGTLAYLSLKGTINQTGGANGITRGLYINPTLTSAADFRAIETTNGKIVFGNLPTSSAGLPTGALWNDAGTVKIV